jgi:soluble lytic murein transglycosylase
MKIRIKSISLLLILLLASSPLLLTAPAAKSDKDEFEQLCRLYVEKPGTGTQSQLIIFCKKKQNQPWARLGYLLVGLKEFEAEKYAAAAELLALAESPEMPLDDYALYYLAVSRSRQGQFGPAALKLRAFLSSFPQSFLAVKAQALYWENLLASNQPQLVLDSIQQLPQPPASAERFYSQAKALEALGQLKEALHNYQTVYYQFPLFENGTNIGQKIKALAFTSGEPLAVPLNFRLMRLEKQMAGSKYDAAWQYLKQSFQEEPALAGNARLQCYKGAAEYRLGRYQAALATLLAIQPGDASVEAESGYYITECYRKLDDYEQSAATLNAMEQRSARSLWFEEALFSMGNYHLVRQNLEQSAHYYEKLLAKDCHWRLAWWHYRQKDYVGAYALFIEHLKRFENSEYRAAALYWIGRCLLNTGKIEDAQRVFKTLQIRYFNDYYGQLSARQLELYSRSLSKAPLADAGLEKLLQELATPYLPAALRTPFPWQEDKLEAWPRVHAFALIHLYDYAAVELLRGSGYGDSPTVLYQAARLYYLGKQFRPGIITLRRLWPSYTNFPYATLPEQVWKIFFPADYTSIILRESAKHQLDSSLVMALILQESSFKADAISRANAHGLMQLLPSTARLVAHQAKMRRPTATQLHDPSINIRLGTTYFATLLQHFNGQVEKALASYNAGSNRVEDWVSASSFADAAEFVESIPFSETRGYVKIIMRDRWFYQRLYNN